MLARGGHVQIMFALKQVCQKVFALRNIFEGAREFLHHGTAILVLTMVHKNMLITY